MLATCPALASGDAFLGSLLRHIDCQGRTLGAAGYEALAAPTSPVGLALTSVLVIFVALFGLRLALGEATTLRDAVVAIVKIGIVLTLATSWPAFQVVVYDVIVDGPAQVARALGFSTDSSGAEALINRLQDVDRAIVHLTNLGTGRGEFSVLPQPAGSLSGEAPQRFPISDNPAFGWARVLFLSSTVAAFAAVRLTAGLLLALAPVFAALLLFDMAKGLFVGWARALVFTFLASIAVALVLGVELALLEPWLNDAISARRGGGVVPSTPVELLVLCLAFAAALVGSLGLLLRMSFMGSVSLQNPLRILVDRIGSATTASEAAGVATASGGPHAGQTPSRALVVADAVAAAQRRESARTVTAGAGLSARSGGRAPMQGAAGLWDDLVIPSFGPAARRARPRTSLGARLRDHRS
jgi:type IV secretion system protein VirB6